MSKALARRGVIHSADKKILMLTGNKIHKNSGTFKEKKKKSHSSWKKKKRGVSLVVQWFRLRAPTAGNMGSIPDQGTKSPHAVQCSQKKNPHIAFRTMRGRE